MSTRGATWVGAQVSIASVRSGEELLGTVVAAEPTALVLYTDIAYADEAFVVGDNLRAGWALASRWQHGVAMLVGLNAAEGTYTISMPEATENPEVRRSASRIEAFYAIRALVPDNGELRTVNGRSFEVSVGGFSARFAEPLPKHAPLAVSITIGDEVIAAVATIVRASARHLHAAFCQIRETDRERLASALGMRAIGG